jgi:predicted ribosomally synthesized peptide with SipW-like signal peptide
MSKDQRNRSRKVTLTLLVIGVVAAIVGAGTFSAFSSQTSNSGNSFAAGTVVISDNDAGSYMYSVSNRKPGDTVTQCITVTYSGSLPADVRLYTTSSINAFGQYVNLTVDKGTATGATFPGCGTFTSEATVYSGTLSNFASTRNSYANGAGAYPGSQTQWNQNDTLVYRFTLTLQDDNNANGGASGSHSFTWEARNQ